MEQQKNAELTVRENRLVQGIAEGLPVTEAARRAGYSEHSATSHVYHILKRPRVQSFLTEALERAGITPEQIVAPYVQCLAAAHVLKDPVTREVIPSQVPDVKTRMEAADRIARLFGQVPTAVEMPPAPPPGLTVNITVKEPKPPPAPAASLPPSGDERLYAPPIKLRLQTRPDSERR